MKTVTNDHPSRRRALMRGAAGLSGLLLRSLALGVPPAWLNRPLHAFGQEDMAPQQLLILSTSSAGDPMNANCPGSYHEGIENNPLLTPVDFTLGEVTTRAAEPWSLLPERLRSRLAFIHYQTNSAAHIEYKSTMTFHGSVKNAEGNGSEMFSSAIADLSHESIGTLQPEPLPLCKEILTVKGQPLQNLKPTEIKSLFAGNEGTFSQFQSLRDQVLDGLYADLRVSGTRTQRRFLDQYALSREQARALGENLGTLLEALPTHPDEANGAVDQAVAAVALARLKIAPVITINIPFGRDNHQDSTLTVEAEQTRSGVAAIGRLWDELESADLTEQVTFATMNVFGRTLNRNGAGGRNHNRRHAVMAAFGPRVRAGVYGGALANGSCSHIDAVTGAAVSSGGIPPEHTMESMGKSLAVALGHTRDVAEVRIRGGQVIERFLNV